MAASPSSVMVPRMKLGSQGLEVSAQGLGCMGMSAMYGPPKPEPDMIALVHHAIAAGVTFLDTSDVYGPHTNELLLGKALQGVARERVDLATKFGVSFADGKLQVRGDPAYVRAACEASLRRLGVDCIDLYYQHRIDTTVPIEVTIGELKKLVEEGKIKYIGLSEACASTIRRAHAVHPITAVQLEWSLWTRDAEQDIIPTCRELGIGIVAYCPLGSGFFSSGGKLMDSLLWEDAMKPSTFGAAMVAPSSRAPTTKPAISLDVSPSISSPLPSPLRSRRCCCLHFLGFCTPTRAAVRSTTIRSPGRLVVCSLPRRRGRLRCAAAVLLLGHGAGRLMVERIRLSSGPGGIGGGPWAE